jgi:hypothetical protein
MKPACSFLSLVCASGLLAAQSQSSPVLGIEVEPSTVSFHVSGMEGVFLGGVIVSLSPDLMHYFQGLPPMLADFAVLGVGAAFERYSIAVPRRTLPSGIEIHVQGLVADVEILSTEVATLVLDKPDA